MSRHGLLLINLGTPLAPRVGEVRMYLREFLSDPRVLDIPAWKRFLLLELLILPRRSAESAKAYQSIWTERGSPLLVHGLDLVARLRALLGPSVHVELGMRYQKPSIAEALAAFRERGIDEIVVFPMFPQYSSAASGSAIERLFREAGRVWNVPALSVVPPYYDHPEFIGAFAEVARPHLDSFSPDRVLFSYHGLPERHVRKSDESRPPVCLSGPACCDEIRGGNRHCYRAQCLATSRALAAALALAPGSHEDSFQSRLGREPWIRPYTDVRLRELAEGGVKRLAVLCPAFTADCLETLEEIAMRGREEFRALGGEDLRLIPSLNAEECWARAIIEIASAHARWPVSAGALR